MFSNPAISSEDSLTNHSSASVFSHYRHFSEVAFTWLGWLLDAPAPGLFSTSPILAEASLIWLIDQLGPMSEELEKSLDQLVTLDFADDLVSPAHGFSMTTSNSTHSLPLSMLLLLRLLKAHIAPSCDSEKNACLPLAFSSLVKQQALLELYTRQGLPGLCSFIECLTDHLLVVAELPQYSHSPEPALTEMLALTVEIVTLVIDGLCCTREADFVDVTPVRFLCSAYAASVYIESLPTSASLQRTSCLRVSFLLQCYQSMPNSPKIIVMLYYWRRNRQLSIRIFLLGP